MQAVHEKLFFSQSFSLGLCLSRYPECNDSQPSFSNVASKNIFNLNKIFKNVFDLKKN